MKYRKKPVVIEAIQWNGLPDPDGTEETDKLIAKTREELFAFTSTSGGAFLDGHRLRIATLEGMLEASPGDFIIRGIKGELYPCKPDIFEATYEPVKAKEQKPA